MRLSFRSAAAALVILLLAPATSAFAVEIVAVVNGQPITDYDVSQRVALQRISGESPSSTTATNELIDEMVELTEAIRLGAVISSDQVDAAFAQVAQQVNLSISDFRSALGQAGVDPDSLKARLRAQIAWSLLLQARVQQQDNAVRQDAVTQQLLATGGAAQTVRQYQMQRIVFVVPSGSTNAYINQRTSEAAAFRQRFQGCDSSLTQAQALRGVVVLDIGRDTSQLSSTQQAALTNVNAGHTTPPERTSRGVELIAVCAVQEVQGNETARTTIQNQLLIQQADQIGQDYLADLRTRAIIQRF